MEAALGLSMMGVSSSCRKEKDGGVGGDDMGVEGHSKVAVQGGSVVGLSGLMYSDSGGVE